MCSIRSMKVGALLIKQVCVCVCVCVIAYAHVYMYACIFVYVYNYLFNLVYSEIKPEVPALAERNEQTNNYRIWRLIRRTPISAGKSRKNLMKQNAHIKRDEINIMNISNDNSFNLHSSLCLKVTLKSKLTGF